MNLKIFTKNIEDSALKQIHELLKVPAFKDCKVRIMPDVHAGSGCVIGFTADLGDKVIPNIVGVDIGCLDKDTEVLTPNGWIKISEYNDQNILIYDDKTNKAYYEKPPMYIKQPCDEFYHFKNKKGLDQMVSEEHRMLVFKGHKFKKQVVLQPQELNQFSLKKGYYNFKTSFEIVNNGLDLTENQIRILVMVQADGCLKKNNLIELHFSKERKIERARILLKNEGLKYNEYKASDNSTYFSFKSELFYTKNLTKFYLASKEQLKVLVEECLYWDGCVSDNKKYFYSTDKNNADVIQFAYASIDIRATICKKIFKNKNRSHNYVVTIIKNNLVNYDTKGVKIKSEDSFKYCFKTSTGFFVARRNDYIFITGNCGMLTVNLGNINLDLEKLDNVIKENVPAGKNIHNRVMKEFDFSRLKCYNELKNVNRLKNSLGTLGGGNHFIEIDTDAKENKYLIIHTGSRSLGKQIAEIYQQKAFLNIQNKENDLNIEIKNMVEKCKEKNCQNEIAANISILRTKYREKFKNIPKELCYIENKDRDDYLHDMEICQEFSTLNRKIIAEIICDKLGIKHIDMFETIHNYISFKDNIIRKGSISAYKDEKVLIPINMRDGCIIGIGKGNSEWNQSAPHGAGRIMSRAQAKKEINIDDFKDSMKNIYSTTVNESTLDEAPFAYKPIQEIVDNIKDTVEIIEIIKPIYNFKASE